MIENVIFGCASGEAEGKEHPSLVSKGFYDDSNLISDLLNTNKFLVLGNKGSGKSLTAVKLKTTSKSPALPTQKKNFETSVTHLSNFPYTNFAKILPVQSGSESKYTETWKFLLLSLVLTSFYNDPKGTDTENLEFREQIDSLIRKSIISIGGLNSLVKTTTKKTFKVSIPQFFEFGNETNGSHLDYESAFYEIIEHLKDTSTTFHTISKHNIVIDGLDDFLTLKSMQNHTLSNLIYASEYLNNFFLESSVSAKIIVVCRTDIFEKLELPNKNKTKRDFAIELNWYHDPRQPETSRLIKLVEQRARLYYIDNIFHAAFPKEIGRSSKKEIRHFLLDHTRHTPRDFTQLMNCISKYAHKGMKLNESQIYSGLSEYSTEYFLPEVKDELVGHTSIHIFEAIIEAIKSINQREFLYSALMNNLSESITHEDTYKCLVALFNCGAIGHKWDLQLQDDKTEKNRYEFKYRNRNATFDRKKTIVIHKGMWKALNMI
ncbi:hypothetical protein HNP10_000596 [Aeromonas veronii]|uniref:P-loop ATPase, Sll1717 family n=1 Tax=Aeromonas veronii TaxID=654 RepID=UPI001617BEFC|nr:hypothetical protein [Aeromonas veronii]MCS3831881.1 hypothetical protein [Aeromonas veronii]